MPDLPTIAGGPSDAASTPGSSTGITLTANASGNTKATTYTELIASTSYDTSWVLVDLTNMNAASPYLVDIAVGASTSEVVLIPDLVAQCSSTSQQRQLTYLFPLRIPRSTRISARCQCATGSATIVVSVHLFASPISAPPSLGRVEASVTSASSRGILLNDPGGSAHTDGTWTQIIASTGFNYRWMCLGLTNTQDITHASSLTHLLDIGVGAGGSEQVYIADLLTMSHTSNDAVMAGGFCFPVAIASGSRIAARHRSSTTTTGDRRLEVALYGVG